MTSPSREKQLKMWKRSSELPLYCRFIVALFPLSNRFPRFFTVFSKRNCRTRVRFCRISPAGGAQ
jgi:hypothetical protein